MILIGFQLTKWFTWRFIPCLSWYKGITHNKNPTDPPNKRKKKYFPPLITPVHLYSSIYPSVNPTPDHCSAALPSPYIPGSWLHLEMVYIKIVVLNILYVVDWFCDFTREFVAPANQRAVLFPPLSKGEGLTLYRLEGGRKCCFHTGIIDVRSSSRHFRRRNSAVQVR